MSRPAEAEGPGNPRGDARGADDTTIGAARRLLGVPIGAGSATKFAETQPDRSGRRLRGLLWLVSNPTVHGVTDDTIGEHDRVRPTTLADIKARAPAASCWTADPARASTQLRTLSRAIRARRPIHATESIAAAWAVATLPDPVGGAWLTRHFFRTVRRQGPCRPPAAEPRRAASKRLAVSRRFGTPTPLVGRARARGSDTEGKQSVSMCIAYTRRSVLRRLPEGQAGRGASPGRFPGDAIAGAPPRSATSKLSSAWRRRNTR